MWHTRISSSKLECLRKWAVQNLSYRWIGLAVHLLVSWFLSSLHIWWSVRVLFSKFKTAGVTEPIWHLSSCNSCFRSQSDSANTQHRRMIRAAGAGFWGLWLLVALCCGDSDPGIFPWCFCPVPDTKRKNKDVEDNTCVSSDIYRWVNIF